MRLYTRLDLPQGCQEVERYALMGTPGYRPTCASNLHRARCDSVLREGKCEMLLSFRFANHRSFRDEQQIDLTPAYESDYKDEAVRDSVPVVGIFGANASGKSNAVNALAYMRQMAVFSDRDAEPDGGIYRSSFRLDPKIAEQPSRYVADFQIDEIRHTYGFSLNGDEVLEEWLYSYPLKKRRKIFDRTKGKFTFGEAAQKTSIERATEITPANALFLPVAARAGQKLVIPIFNWFYRGIRFSIQHARPPSSRMLADRFSEEADKDVVINLLKAADLGLKNVQLVDSESDEHGQLDLDIPTASSRNIRRYARRSPEEAPRLLFTHTGSHGDALFEWNEESTGTRQLFDLAMRAQRALHEGTLLVVDEIDSSLHPVLTASLIKLFQGKRTNTSGGQLILTTHDSTLLGSIRGDEVLRRDQIWFVEKDGSGASNLFPLSDFQPRRQENRQRRYLNGSYGAIPEISDDLFVKAIVARERRGQASDDDSE